MVIKKVERLDLNHDLLSFDSGEQLTNDYFWHQARLDHDDYSADVFVALNSGNQIVGCYSLQNTRYDQAHIPIEIPRQSSSKYTSTLELSWLAVDKKYQRQGIGSKLLGYIIRSFNESPYEVLHATALGGDANLIEWYKSFGFVQIPRSGQLFLGKSKPG